MNVRPRSFPHPVLSPFSDDVQPNQFELAVATSYDKDFFYLATSFSYNNTTLAELSERGLAAHVLHVECKHNYYRRLHSLPCQQHSIAIPTSELRGRVELSGLIVATTTLKDYTITGAHPDYDGIQSQLEAGDVLAIARSLSFDAYVDYDPLSSIASILAVRESETEEEGSMRLGTEEDQLVVTLSKGDYRRYTDLKGDQTLGPLLANQVVVPAVAEALTQMRHTPEEDRETEMTKRWYRSVSQRLAELKINLDESTSLDAAQALLRLPLRRSLEGLIQATAGDGEA